MKGNDNRHQLTVAHTNCAVPVTLTSFNKLFLPLENKKNLTKIIDIPKWID
jgi:hypothetical protein